MLAILLNDVTR